MSDIFLIPAGVELETEGEVFHYFSAILKVAATWYRGAKETFLDPGEPQGFEVENLQLVVGKEYLYVFNAGISMMVWLGNTGCYFKLEQKEYQEGECIDLDEDRLREVAQRWIAEYEQYQREDQECQKAEARQ